jgi:hypothetical protein
MTTLKEYLVLSQISYNDFYEGEIDLSIGQILNILQSSLNKYLAKKGNEVWKNQLETVKDWTLLNCQNNTKAGFAAAAFRSPEGERVIAFRGTEPTLKQIRLYIDAKTDTKIYTGFDDELIEQFSDAKEFVRQTLKINSLDEINKAHNLSFTGHSLGGALADYLAYLTKDTTSTTFNAVGFAQCLTVVELISILSAPESYRGRIKDYCDSWDIIGNSGIHIGDRTFLINDQVLDEPYYIETVNNAANPWDYYTNQLAIEFKNLWDYLMFKCKENIDQASDFFKKLINSYIPVTGLITGSPYSHGLKHFLNDINADESLIESNIVGSSEVEFYKDITKIFLILNKAGKLEKQISERSFNPLRL